MKLSDMTIPVRPLSRRAVTGLARTFPPSRSEVEHVLFPMVFNNVQLPVTTLIVSLSHKP